MLTYRGDKFVKGKKFTINESVYRFVKRDKDENLIFESVNNKRMIKLTESEYELKEQQLLEKINKENQEINSIIGQALRSKSVAKKYEDKLKSYGITVDFDQSQGATLLGPNGKRLSATSKEVVGPSKPGQAGTHSKANTGYWEPEVKEYREKVDKLKNMKRDDIIRAYNNLDSKEAMAQYKKDLESAQKSLADYTKRVADDYSEARAKRREGHLEDPSSGGRYSRSDSQFSKEQADKTVDYLNYLTKPSTGDDFRKGKSYRQGKTGYYGHSTKNPVDNSRAENLVKYDELKSDVEHAQDEVNWATYDKDKGSNNMSYAAMTDKQLEQKIKKMRADLEKEIKDLVNNNSKNQERRKSEVKNLRAKEKELDTYLKNRGVRETVKAILKGETKLLKESDLVNSGNKNADYIEEQSSQIYDDVLTLAKEAKNMGFYTASKQLQDILDILEELDISQE